MVQVTDQEVTVKATPLQAVLDYMSANLSAEARERVFAATSAAFPDEAKIARTGRVLATERVPLRFTVNLVEATATELRRPANEVAHEIGRLGAEAASKGVMRLALTLISIPNLLRKLGPVWQQLYSHGRMVNTSAERTASIELLEFPFVSATLCARVTGWFSWFAEKAEKTATVSHVTRRARGDASCRWQIDW